MNRTQRQLCCDYLNDHWHDDMSTEQLLARAADYVRTACPNRPFDESDVAEIIYQNKDRQELR